MQQKYLSRQMGVTYMRHKCYSRNKNCKTHLNGLIKDVQNVEFFPLPENGKELLKTHIIIQQQAFPVKKNRLFTRNVLHLPPTLKYIKMKKYLFTALVLTACFLKNNAQSLQLIDTTGGANIQAQGSYTLNVDTNAAGNFMFNIHNLTSSIVNFQVKKTVISNTGSDGITFCVGGSCYTPATTVSGTISISAGGNLPIPHTVGSYGLSTDFAASSTPNTAKVRYTLTNISNQSDSVSVIINYNVVNNTAGIQQVTGINNQIAVYPNPASSDVSFSYTLGNVSQAAAVKIYNMLGALVKTVSLDTFSNTTKIDVNSLEEGVYIYSVMVGGKAVKTSRLVISR